MKTYQYNAFLSYSQTEDKALAAAIQTALQKINMPWHRLKKPKLSIFRDATHLGNSVGNLPESIKEGIRASEKFILLGSPESSRSYYVNLEVEYFKSLCAERGSNLSNNLIVILTKGDLVWNNEINDW